VVGAEVSTGTDTGPLLQISLGQIIFNDE